MTNEKALYKTRDLYSNDLSMVGKNNSDANIWMEFLEWNFDHDAPKEIRDSFLTTLTRWRLSRRTVFRILYCIYSMPTCDHRVSISLPPDRFFFFFRISRCLYCLLRSNKAKGPNGRSEIINSEKQAHIGSRQDQSFLSVSREVSFILACYCVKRMIHGWYVTLM